MARKQTLKQLLGSSDDRVEVDLNIGTPRLRNVIERGGSYSTAFVNAPKTNNFSKIADALGKVNPIIKEYQDTKRIGKEAEITEGEAEITEGKAGVQQFKNFLAGADDETKKKAISDLLAQQDKTKAGIDKYFRNEYGLNPLASIRAQRLLGATKEAEYLAYRNKRVQEYKQKLGGVVPSQEDVETFVYGLADAFLEDENVNMEKGSLTHQGFMSSIMEQTGSDIATLQTVFSEYHRDNIVVPALATSVFRAYEKHIDNPDNSTEVVEFLKESWKDTGMLGVEQQQSVIKTAFDLIPPENQDEAEDFLESLTEADIKIGNQKFGDTLLYQEIAQSIEDKTEIYEVEQEREATKDHDKLVTEYTAKLNGYYDKGAVSDANEWITETEEKLEKQIKDQDGVATDLQNKMRLWLSDQRLGQDNAMSQRYLRIQQRSGLDERRTSGLLERAVAKGIKNFRSTHPELAEFFDAAGSGDKPPFEYDVVTGEYTINLEGHQEFNTARQKWVTSTRKALQDVLDMGLTPEEQGKKYAESQNIADNTFVENLVTLATNSYVNRSKRAKENQISAQVQSVTEIAEEVGGDFFKNQGQSKVYELQEVLQLGGRGRKRLKASDTETMNAYGAAIAEIEDETERNNERNKYNQIADKISLRNEQTRNNLINELDEVKRNQGRNLRERKGYNRRVKSFISKNSETVENTLRLEAFTAEEALALLETGAARGNETRELQHSSGFRLQPDFFNPANLVYIEGLNADADTTKRIAALLNIGTKDLVNFHKNLKKIREQ